MKRAICAFAVMVLASVGFASPLAIWVTNNVSFGVINSNNFRSITVVTNVTSTNYVLTAFGDTDRVRGTLGWPSDKYLIMLVHPTLKPTTNVPVIIKVSDLLSLSVTGNIIHAGSRPTVERIVNINSNNYRKISGSTTNFQYQILDCGADFKLRYAGINADGTLQCVGQGGGLINVAIKNVLWLDIPTIQPVDSTYSMSVVGVSDQINKSNVWDGRINGLQTATNALRAEIAAVSNVFGTAGLTRNITNQMPNTGAGLKTNVVTYVKGVVTGYAEL